MKTYMDPVVYRELVARAADFLHNKYDLLSLLLIHNDVIKEII